MDNTRILQHFQGIVSDVEEQSFFARILDITDKSQLDEIVEIPFNKIPEDDRELVQHGAIFSWKISESKDGPISEIKMRRHPVRTEQMISQIKAEAHLMETNFKENHE